MKQFELVEFDAGRGKKVAEVLLTGIQNDGIHGQKLPPESAPPKGVLKGSQEHILFITLTSSLDYNRDSDRLWETARKTYEDPNTRYLFFLSV